MMVIFENEYARIEHDEQDHLIFLTWKKFTPSFYYREVMTVYYEVRMEKRIFKTVSDCRLLPVISPEDYQWSVALSRKYSVLIPYDELKTAVVMSGNIFTKVSIESLLKEFADHPEYANRRNYLRYFDSLEEAKKWVLEYPVSNPLSDTNTADLREDAD